MKIYTQDRERIIEIPREIWVTQYGIENFAIIGTAYLHGVIGLYETEQRAKEVLQEIFECYRNSKNSYVMPAE